MNDAQRRALRVALADPGSFSRALLHRQLYAYQLEPARAIARAALRRDVGQVVVLMSRQAGKNELSAHAEAYLLALHAHRGGAIVKAASTFKPQLITSMLRLRATLGASALLGRPTSQWGYVLGLGRASCTFLSAEPHANVVGATASLLLEFDEAQDIGAAKHDRAFVPMAASTHAPRVYYGTAWTDDDLLQRMKAAARERQRQDGVRRVFEYTWEAVAEVNPAYGDFVRAERRRLGGRHPVYLTQYCLIPVATADRLLGPDQLALLRGDHDREDAPGAGPYVMGVDLGGPVEDDPSASEHARDRDATAVTIGRVTLAGVLPAVQVVHHRLWVGRPHWDGFEELCALAVEWRAQRLVVDATGLGGPIAEALARRLGPVRVVPFVFTQARKSALGYDLLAWINARRVTHHRADPDDELYSSFFEQARTARRELRPSKLMAWAVPPPGHDDLLVATALCAHAALDAPPVPAGATLHARPDDDHRGRFA